MSDIEKPLDLLLIAHTAEKGFVKTLRNRLMIDEELRVFYDEESIDWGEVTYMKLTEALRGRIVHGALLVVSESLLERPTPKLQHLVDAVLDRMPIFPLLRGVSEATFQERMPLLRTARSVDGDGDLGTIASEISRRLRRRQQRREDDLRPTALPQLTFGFDGRATELDDLLGKVLAGTPAVAVTGLPGLGKSQVVIALGRRLANLDWTVVYVHVAPYATENEVAAVILRAINERSSSGREFGKLQEIVCKLPESSTRLIILNRCDHLIKNNLGLLKSLLLILTPVFRIVTASSRSIDCFNPTVEPFPMKPLNVDVTADIILARLNTSEIMIVTPEKAQRLANLCGGMPMAIQLLISGLRRGFSDDDLPDSDTQVRFLEYLDKVSEAMESDRMSVMIQAIYDLLPESLQNHLMGFHFFQLPFTKDDAADLLHVSRREITCDILLPLVNCSLLTQASSDVYYLHTLVCQFLRNKCKSGPRPRLARVQYVALQSSKLQIAVDKYKVNAVDAIHLFDSNRANYRHMFKFVNDFDVTDVSKQNIHLALDAASLLKAVVSSEERYGIFKLCSRAAEESRDWQSYILLEMRAFEAVLDNTASVVSPEDNPCLTRAKQKAEELKDQSLMVECAHMEAQQLMVQNNFYAAFRMIKNVTTEPWSKANPLLAASCNSALGAASEDVDETRGSQSAIHFYNTAREFLEFHWHNVRGVCSPYPDVCALQLRIARCLYNNSEFKKSENAYLKVLCGQKALLCNPLSLVIVRHHVAIAKLSNVCVAFSNQEDIKSVVNDLKRIDKEMEEILHDELHPLKAWNSLAIGKGLAAIEAKTRRWKQAKASGSYEEAESYFTEALDVSESISLHETDYTELAVECYAYLHLIDHLLRNLGKKETRVDYERKCRSLAKGLKSTRLSSVAKFVTKTDKGIKPSNYGGAVQTLLRQNAPCFAECFSVVQRWQEIKQRNFETGQSHTMMENGLRQQQVSPSGKPLSLAMIKWLVYPDLDRSNDKTPFCGLSI